MKQFRLALIAFVSALGFTRLHAQATGDEEAHAPPTEIPDFSNLDEYIYEPKSTLIIGFRYLSGVKTKFYGNGYLAAPETPFDATTPNIQRTYHDGSVSPDDRNANRANSNSNPVTDSSNGGSAFDPIAVDGKTNTWTYTYPSQVSNDGNYIAFHNYSATITDPLSHNQNGDSSDGVDVSVARDMGKVFGTRATWALIGGVTLNNITSKNTAAVQATLTTITDLYSFDGQVLPQPASGTLPGSAQYTAPSSTTTTVLDSNGVAVLNSDGSTQTASTATTVLLNNKPINRSTSNTVDTASVVNIWDLRGAYATLRAGAEILVPITGRFRATASAGPALVYAGSTYTVTQSYQPLTGNPITDTEFSSETRFLPAYFADASLQFDLTEHTGFFAGAVFQSAGSYTQTLNANSQLYYGTTAHYSTNVNFGNQNGLRAGMTVRF